MTTLVFNAGSSSLKFRLYTTTGGDLTARSALQKLKADRAALAIEAVGIERPISPAQAPVAVYVVSVDEERSIARDVLALLTERFYVLPVASARRFLRARVFARIGAFLASEESKCRHLSADRLRTTRSWCSATISRITSSPTRSTS